jgi:hypothetical protein
MLRTRGHTIVLPDGSVRFPHKLAAVFGLLGFSVGGSLNIVGGLIIAARHEKRQPRTAARLLMSELEEIASELRVCIMVRTWPTQIQTKQWAEFESRLANALGNSDRDAVSSVYTSVRLLGVRLPIPRASPPTLTMSRTTDQSRARSSPRFRFRVERAAPAELRDDCFAARRAVKRDDPFRRWLT